MTSQARSNHRYAWFVVAMLWVVCFFNYADRQALFSVFPLLQKEFRLSDVQLGVVAACFMWMYAIFGPVAGWISDRVSRKTIILGALTFWSVVTAGTAIAQSYWSLILFRSLGGLGEAFYFPAAMSLIGIYHGTATRSRAMALHQSSVYAGTIAGGVVSAVIAQNYGWRRSFLLFGVLGVLLAIMLFLSLREPLRPEKELGVKSERMGFAVSLMAVLQNLPAVVLIGVFVGANFVAVVFLTWLPTFLQRSFHMNLADAGFHSTAYLQLASVLGVLLGGVLADAMQQRWRYARQKVQAVSLFCGVPFLFLTGQSPTLRGFALGMIGFGFFKGMYDANIWASLYDVIRPEHRGFATGLMNSIGWLGGGTAPIVVGVVSQHFGLAACLSATSAIYFCLAIVLVILSRRRSRVLVTAD